MIDKINRVIERAATLGRLGAIPFGSTIASILALPVMMLLRALYHTNLDLYHIVFTTFLISTLGIIQWALLLMPAYETYRIILGVVWGASLTLYYVPFSFHCLLTAFIAFHLARLFLPLVLYRWTGITLQELPYLVSMVIKECGAGCLALAVVQGIRLLMRW